MSHDLKQTGRGIGESILPKYFLVICLLHRPVFFAVEDGVRRSAVKTVVGVNWPLRN